MSVKIHKLIEKKHLGYRCMLNDQVMFETDNERSRLTVDNMALQIEIDITPHTIETLYEFFRYLKSDLEGDK
tara:strand:- start:210 stop:425 length:216 start_codon:yes stop_codon:yes gene_type:complete